MEGRANLWQAISVGLLLLWVAATPPLISVFVYPILQDSLSPAILSLVAAGAVLVVLIIPLGDAAFLLRNQKNFELTVVTAAVLTGVAGYLLLDVLLGGLLPSGALWAPAVRLLLLTAYAVGAAWWLPPLARAEPRPAPEWLAVDRPGGTALGLSLALAALLTIFWPITGALGDRFTAIEIVLETLAEVVPAAILIWGVAFGVLSTSYRSTILAGLLTLLSYALLLSGGILQGQSWGAPFIALLLIPLALLATELRIRGESIWPVMVLLFCFLVVPRLMIDPRDMKASGIPIANHVLSYLISWGALFPLWMLLFFLRKAADYRREDYPEETELYAGVKTGLAIFAGMALWLIWGLVYVFAGHPGFADDGFLIIMEEHADLAGAEAIADREERIAYVRDRLIGTAESSQQAVRAELDALGLPYRPYYVINVIRVDGHRMRMQHFADLPGVKRVILNPNVRDYPNDDPATYTAVNLPEEDLLGNLDAIDAEEVWEEGVTGEGIVVAGQDTGYDWTHPALLPHYRGWVDQEAHHDYNWHDAWDQTPFPFDDDSHGTHTMGTILGDDYQGHRTGVAPGAQWIGCRNMRRGLGNPGAYAECMEFFLAPYPIGGDSFTDGDVSRAPHLINNSWGCPRMEGCFEDTLRPAVEALRAAGIMMVVSAGNDGPECSTAGTPPANYDASYSVGATTGAGQITSFSSRGPVGNLHKPDIVAPGSEIPSALPGGGYGTASGTSMAAPHVSGVIALVWSANPELIGQIDLTERLLCETATPQPLYDTCDVTTTSYDAPCACGETTGTPNNVYGCGVINAGDVVERALKMVAP